MKIISRLLITCGLFASALPAAAAFPPATGYYSITYDTVKGTATLQLAGDITVAPSSTTLKSGAVISLGGTSGIISTTYGITASTFQAGDGTASTPSYRGATSGLGMYFTSGGTPSVNFITDGVTIAGSASGTKICGGSGLANGQACLRAGSSLTNPGLQWINDSNSGYHWVSADFLELVAGGVASLGHTATTVTFFPSTVGSSTYTINSGLVMGANEDITLSGASGYLTTSSSVTASSFFGDGSHLSGIVSGSSGHSITTGTLTAGATPYTSRSVLTFDSAYFTAVDTPTLNATFISLSTTAAGLNSRQVFTSGTAQTYNTPSGVTQLKIRACAGGGGGGASATNAGSDGGDTVFDNITMTHGGGGVSAGQGLKGGLGGSAGANTANGVFASSSVFCWRGGDGEGGDNRAYYQGTQGGASPFGGAGGAAAGSAAGLAAAINSCSGGGGGNGNGSSGTGGGAGQYCEIIINSPSASYTYSVGALGAGGTAGTNAGGNGGAGVIIVDEIRDFVAGGNVVLSATQTFSGANTFLSSVTVTASKVRGISGGVLVSSTGISGATSTTLAGLDGNTEKNWRIEIEGLQTGTDAQKMILQLNGDSGANYKGVLYHDLGSFAAERLVWTTTSMQLTRHGGTEDLTVAVTIKLHAAVTSPGRARCMKMTAGHISATTYYGYSIGGGCWTNTADNITSLVFTWPTTFTGSVTVYQD